VHLQFYATKKKTGKTVAVHVRGERQGEVSSGNGFHAEQMLQDSMTHVAVSVPTINEIENRVPDKSCSLAHLPIIDKILQQFKPSRYLPNVGAIPNFGHKSRQSNQSKNAEKE
jgi:hypothetical protein